MATCRELATNVDAMAQIQRDYWMLEKSATPVALLLPWFPGTAKKSNEIATRNLFTTLYGYVEMRRKADTRTSDAIDVLLSRGLTSEETVGVRHLFLAPSAWSDARSQCILSVVFAGVVQTGVNGELKVY